MIMEFDELYDRLYEKMPNQLPVTIRKVTQCVWEILREKEQSIVSNKTE